MLLETLDVKRNDVLIYSENVFDFDNNFRIIFKKDNIKRAYKINYFDVCDFINEPAPKNIIVYRLLTNVSSLDAYSTKYGYFINSQSGTELIYLDPIFAIKDLKNLKFDLNLKDFRFKIQQVGYTTLTSGSKSGDFTEIFSSDMRAVEAQNQNDRIFADALFLFDENFISDDEHFSFSERENANKQNTLAGGTLNNLREIKSTSNIDIQLGKPNLDINKPDTDKELKKQMLKQALGIEKTNSNFVINNASLSNFSSFLEKYRNEVYSKEDIRTDVGLDELFKKNSDKNKKKDSFILRLTNEIS